MSGLGTPFSSLSLSWLALLLALAGCAREEPTRPPNVVIVVLDAARADHFGAYGYERDTTPHFDALARESVVFDRAISNASFTVPTVASLFAGQPPAQVGVMEFDVILEPEVVTLAESLRAQGYRTAAFTENPLIRPGRGFDQGFDEYRKLLDMREVLSSDVIDLSGSREHIREMATWTDEAAASGPFFLYAHLLRPHSPYRALPEHAGRFSRPGRSEFTGGTREIKKWTRHAHKLPRHDLEHLIDLYDENLVSADALLGELVEHLRSAERLDETILLVLSDHGEAFGEHGLLLHGNQVHGEDIRIPLLIRFPPSMGIEPGRHGALIQPSHLMPLLLAALSDAEGGGMAEGGLEAFLAAGRASEAQWPVISHAYNSISLRDSQYKIILNPGAPRPHRRRLYKVDEDPKELSDLAPKDPARAERMQEALHAALAEQRARAVAEPQHDVDEELRANLRALGYDESEE